MKYTLFLIWTFVTTVNCLPTSYGGYGELEQYSADSSHIGGLRSYGRDRAVLENESKPSQLDSAYSYAQQFAAGFYNPRPLVDTIREEEKYGNDGGTTRKLAMGLVKKVSTFSQKANAFLDAPYDKATQVGKEVTIHLNEIGGYLVGL